MEAYRALLVHFVEVMKTDSLKTKFFVRAL